MPCRRNVNMAAQPQTISHSITGSMPARARSLTSPTGRSITTAKGSARPSAFLARPIVNADGAAVSVEALALQHLAEDMSIIPSAADWLRHIELPETGAALTPPRTPPSAEQLATAGARRFDTAPDVLLPLHSWFLETATWVRRCPAFRDAPPQFRYFSGRTALRRRPRAGPLPDPYAHCRRMACAHRSWPDPRRRGFSAAHLCDQRLDDRSAPAQAASQQVDNRRAAPSALTRAVRPSLATGKE
jgi:hypothetical protein